MTDLRDQGWWEDYFSAGGGWEKNGGREQTRIFAEHFSRHLEIDRSSSFSLLDVGCALGDAIRHFSTAFPNASLFGIDFSETAVHRCRTDLKDLARFDVKDIERLDGHYDVIYCSNVLEHFADFDAKARILLRHCRRLCVLVPYRETKNGQPLHPNPGEHHQVTFDRNSFQYLVRERAAKHVDSYIFSCPGAWGWPLGYKLKQMAKNIIRPFFGKPWSPEPKQIFYDIFASPESGPPEKERLSRG